MNMIKIGNIKKKIYLLLFLSKIKSSHFVNLKRPVMYDFELFVK
jgi:hypothetical protein